MIDPKSLENIGSNELAQMMSDYEGVIRGFANTEYELSISIQSKKKLILELRSEMNDVEYALMKARKERQDAEASHRVIKTTFFNTRNGGQ